MESGIRINKLSYKIGDRDILRDVSLDVYEGQFVGLIGPNGSGKTSMLKHIYKNLPAERNTVFLNEIALENYNYRKMAQVVSVLKQENEIAFSYKVEDIVLMGRIPYKKHFEGDTVEDFSMAKKALEYVGLADYEKRIFSSLSGGEKQRVLLARTLVQETEILLLDEPTNHLDIYYQWKIMDMIKSLNKTVIAVMHELNIAFTFCDYIYVIDKGKIVKHGTPKEICSSEVLKDVFNLQFKIIENNGKPYIIYNY